jgi:hypothetical protein
MNWPVVAVTVAVAGSVKVSQVMLGRGSVGLSPAQRQAVNALERRRRGLSRYIAVAAVVVWVGLLYCGSRISPVAIPWLFLGAVSVVAAAQLFHLRRLRHLDLPAHYLLVWWKSRIPMSLGWAVAIGVAVYTSWFQR